MFDMQGANDTQSVYNYIRAFIAKYSLNIIHSFDRDLSVYHCTCFILTCDF